MSGQTWIKLEDAKRYLRFDPADTSDDLTLQRIVDAAAAMIEDIKGHVQTGPITGEFVEVENLGAVFLTERPVASVQAVRLYRGDGSTVTVPKVDPADPTTVFGWQSRGGVSAGVVQVSNWGPFGCPPGSIVAVDYTFGLDPVPDNFIEAGLELVAHLWKTSQENTSGGRPGIGEPDIEYERGGASYALPFRVRELLGIYGSIVKSTGVMVL